MERVVEALEVVQLRRSFRLPPVGRTRGVAVCDPNRGPGGGLEEAGERVACGTMYTCRGL